MTLEELARRASRFRWIEARLFEILGGWVQALPEPEAQAFCSTVSFHHAWHAELWAGVTPASVLLPAVDREPPAAVRELFDAIANTEGDTAVKLVGVSRVIVPRLATAYANARPDLTDTADGPVMRVLDLAGRDLTLDWGAGERLVQSLLPTPDAVRSAAARQGDLEARLVSAGGLL